MSLFDLAEAHRLDLKRKARGQVAAHDDASGGR
jgi:hypothetical protein